MLVRATEEAGLAYQLQSVETPQRVELFEIMLLQMFHKRARHDEKFVAHKAFMLDDVTKGVVFDHEHAACSQQIEILTSGV